MGRVIQRETDLCMDCRTLLARYRRDDFLYCGKRLLRPLVAEGLVQPIQGQQTASALSELEASHMKHRV